MPVTVQLLRASAARLSGAPVRELFARDLKRFEHFSREFEGLLFDFSRQRLDVEAFAVLLKRADETGLRA
ncbi:MAG TPA: hypothetical protein VIK49_04485, partial [Steroidobacteraceae bacterium]